MRHRDFEYQSVIAKVKVLLHDSGRSVMKFTAMWDPGRSGMGRDMSFHVGRVGRVQRTLACAQVVQDERNQCMSANMFGHEYLLHSRWHIRWVLGWPVAIAVCAQVMSLSRRITCTNFLLGGHDRGICCVSVISYSMSQVTAPMKQDGVSMCSSLPSLGLVADRQDRESTLVFLEPGQ